MKDEIKEILGYLAFLEDIDTQKKVKQVADYITTLQEENERLNNIIKEVREYITIRKRKDGFLILSEEQIEELLEILDKENK